LEVNVNFVNAMWITVAGYLIAQVYTLIAWRHRWRVAAMVPLIVMVPVSVLTVQEYRQQSNLWPILMLFASPPALLYLILLIVTRTTKKKSPE
jgi:hypothetical protein